MKAYLLSLAELAGALIMMLVILGGVGATLIYFAGPIDKAKPACSCCCKAGAKGATVGANPLP